MKEASCSFDVLDAAWATAKQIATRLAAARRPVLVQNARSVKRWGPMNASALLTAYGATRVQISRGTSVAGFGPTYIEKGEVAGVLSLRKFGEQLRGGRLAAGAYVFHQVEEARGMPSMFRELSHLHAEIARQRMARYRALVNASAAQRMDRSVLAAQAKYVSLGGDGSGASFHQHGAAVTALLGGSKQWLVTPTNRYADIHSADLSRRTGAALALARAPRTLDASFYDAFGTL